MKTLIVCATLLEADVFISVFETSYTMKKAIANCYFEPKDKNHPFVLVTGIGKVNSALTLSYFINNVFTPKLVINTGIAGGFNNKNLKIGDVAIANEEVYGDEGVKTEDKFLQLDDLNFPSFSMNNKHFFNIFKIKYNKKLITMLNTMCEFNIMEGRFITVSECSGCVERKEEMEKRFSPICESMEGASVYHVCLAYGIEFFEIRGISNFVGKYDKSKWKIKEALFNTVKCLKSYLEIRGFENA